MTGSRKCSGILGIIGLYARQKNFSKDPPKKLLINACQVCIDIKCDIETNYYYFNCNLDENCRNVSLEKTGCLSYHFEGKIQKSIAM